MSLFWRIFVLNAVVLGTATALLLWAPVTVSVPVLLTEAVILLGGLAVMLVANAVLLRLGLAPLDRLTRLMTTVDLLRPGQRLPASGGGEVTELIRTFNAMLERLEHERATSSARALLAQEAERRRIAQELHDEVGQTMTAILLGLKRAADEAPEGLRRQLCEVQEITRESLDEVRHLVRRLRPGCWTTWVWSARSPRSPRTSPPTPACGSPAASPPTCPPSPRRRSWCSTASPRNR